MAVEIDALTLHHFAWRQRNKADDGCEYCGETETIHVSSSTPK